MSIRLSAAAAGFCAAALVLLTACSSDAGKETGSTAPASSGATTGTTTTALPASLSIGDREFSVELTSCMMHADDEVELEGPTSKASATTGYLSGGASGLANGATESRGEFRINIGASGPFESTDDFVAMGGTNAGDLGFAREGDTYRITAPAWDDNGANLGTGTLSFKC